METVDSFLLWQTCQAIEYDNTIVKSTLEPLSHHFEICSAKKVTKKGKRTQHLENFFYSYF